MMDKERRYTLDDERRALKNVILLNLSIITSFFILGILFSVIHEYIPKIFLLISLLWLLNYHIFCAITGLSVFLYIAALASDKIWWLSIIGSLIIGFNIYNIPMLRLDIVPGY